jgi:hypothetical protein
MQEKCYVAIAEEKSAKAKISETAGADFSGKRRQSRPPIDQLKQ